MKLHLLGIPHTITDLEHSHCAFTGKVQKFPAMMRPKGYHIIHYGVEGADTEAQEHINLMSRYEQNMLRGHDGSDKRKFVGDSGDISNPLYQTFNARLRTELLNRVKPEDLVLLPFGWGHADAVKGCGFTLVESGIGYPDLYPEAPHKIYESFAWMHFHQGRENRSGKNYEWVVPNYFDVTQWDFRPTPEKNAVVYFGRICDIKGLPTVVELAKRRKDLNFIICGQGDPTPYLTEPNITYLEPLSGRARSDLLGRAMAVLMPTVFTEPFAGVAVEAMLCGTPVLSVTYGAFTETIEDTVTGFRCHTLGDWLAALVRAPSLDRAYISSRARTLYGFERVGAMYDRVFQQIGDLRGEGWFSTRSTLWNG
jgi:hypothetical protein